MATIGLRFLRAVLAAVLGGLVVACGGGSESSQTVQPAATTTAAPFAGTAVDQGTDFAGQPRVKALSAPATQDRPMITAATQVAAGGLRIEALAAEAPADRVMTNNEVMNAAQVVYSTLFPGNPGTEIGTASGRTFDYRFYAPSTYLGVVVAGPDVGHLYAIGPFNGNVLTDYGTVAYWSCVFEPVRCGPRIMSAKIIFDNGQPAIDARGATGVAAKGTRLEIGMSDLINCTGLNGLRIVGEFILTVESCRGATLVLTPGNPSDGPPRWPFGSTSTLTLAGVLSLDGYPSPRETVSFTTQTFASDLVFVGNYWGMTDHRDLSTIDRTTGAVVGIALSGPSDSNQFLDGHLAISRSAGVVYAGPNSAEYLYRHDAETGARLTPLPIYRGAVIGDSVQGIRGLASSEKLACSVHGRLGLQSSYAGWNVMMCWDHHTGQKVFESLPGFVADRSKIPFALHYSERNKKFYSLNGTESAVYIEEYAGNKYRDGFRAGTPGTVTEIDCEVLPCRVVNTYPAGSVPQGISEDPVTGILYVTNSGGKSMTTITPSNGSAETRGLPMFTGWQVPMKVLYDAGRLLVGDYMGSVVVLNPATLAETQRVQTGNVPMGMAAIGDEIWVTLPRNVTTGAAQALSTFNRSTLAVKRTYSNVGSQPWAIVAP